MLDKRTLVERLERYDFSKEALDGTKRERGFGNAVASLYSITKMISMGLYKEEDQTTIIKSYDFLADCYLSINFEELEEHEGEEVAVDQLLSNRNLILELYPALNEFLETCKIYTKQNLIFNEEMPGYKGVIEVLEKMINSDKGSNYKRRVIELRKEILE